jgi:hypothetical protein
MKCNLKLFILVAAIFAKSTLAEDGEVDVPVEEGAEKPIMAPQQTNTILHSNETYEATANMTDIILSVKILLEFTPENYKEKLLQLEDSFKEVQEILVLHNINIDVILEEVERELRVAVNQTRNEKFLTIFRSALAFVEEIPNVFFEKVYFNNKETDCKGLQARSKQFETLLTRLTHLRVSAINHVSILSTFIVDLHTEALLESREMTDAFRKILKNFDQLKNEGEGFEIDVSVAIGLLQMTVDMDDDMLKMGDCVEGLSCGTFLRLDVINDPKAPKRNGFSAGKYEDKSEAYVGTGYTNVGVKFPCQTALASLISHSRTTTTSTTTTSRPVALTLTCPRPESSWKATRRFSTTSRSSIWSTVPISSGRPSHGRQTVCSL